MTCHARTGFRRCGTSLPQLSSGPLGGIHRGTHEKNCFPLARYLFCQHRHSVLPGQWNTLDQDQISNVTVLLSQRLPDSTRASGTGTVISNDSTFYIFTASHVAKLMRNDAKVVFRLPGDKPRIVSLLSLTNTDTLQWRYHSTADIAIISLSPEAADLRKWVHDWSFPLHQVSFTEELPRRDADLTFLGYPVVDMNMEHFSPLLFTCYLASGLITQLRSDTRTKCSFFFLSVPSSQGCSGSGVYYSVSKSSYLGGDTTILIGIVHGTLKDDTGGKLAAITPAYYILDFFRGQ